MWCSVIYRYSCYILMTAFVLCLRFSVINNQSQTSIKGIHGMPLQTRTDIEIIYQSQRIPNLSTQTLYLEAFQYNYSISISSPACTGNGIYGMPLLTGINFEIINQSQWIPFETPSNLPVHPTTISQQFSPLTKA